MERKGNRKLTVKNDMARKLVIKLAMELINGVDGVWIGIWMLTFWRAGDRPAWDCYPRLASHLTGLILRSPTQPNHCNFTVLQILIPFPTSFQRSAPGTAPWEGECYVRATVRRCDRMMYDVRRIRHTTYDSTTWSHTLSKHAVSK